MDNDQKITLAEIAEKTGVTRAAVSLALRGKNGVSDATRIAILDVAQSLGYRPDPEVSNLMARIRAKTPQTTKACLALLTSGITTEGSKRSITERKYVEGIVNRSNERGYKVEEFSIFGEKDAARLGTILWSRGIEGIIIRPLQYGLIGGESHSIDFDFDRFCVVAISETLESPDLDRSLHEQYTSMLKVLTELASLNYQNVGLVLEEELNVRVNGKWTAAYLQHQYRAGGKPLPPPLIMSSPSQLDFDRWFDQHRPDVILGVNRFVLRFLKRKGLSIPEDVGYASLDLDSEIPEYEGLSGIDQNSHIVGSAAVDMLVDAMQRARRGIPKHPLRIEITGDWRAGYSTIQQPGPPSFPRVK